MRGSVFVVGAGFSLLIFAAPAPAARQNPHNIGSCPACHSETPRFGTDTAKTVKYVSAPDDPALCRPCHAPEVMLHPVLVVKASGPAGGRVALGLPAGTSPSVAGKVVCTTCHEIHAADASHGLLRGFPGSADGETHQSLGEFCAACHGDNLSRRSAHAGGDKACVFCHAARPRKERVPAPALAARGMCQDCHTMIPTAHSRDLNPFGAAKECLGCHDAHASTGSSPGLLNEAYRAAAADNVTIKPHYRKGLCFLCHANLEDYALRDENLNALCDRCHASGKIAANIHPIRKVPATIRPPKGWPLADGGLTCLTCHEQGHEDQKRRPWMLRGGPYASVRDVCPNCHSAVDMQRSTLHQDVNEGKDCEYCHKVRPVPGTDTASTVTFIADPDLLCTRCHDASGAGASSHHRLLLSREIVPESLPSRFPLFKGRVICGTCHNPHLRESQGARVREYLAETEVCAACHSN